MNRLEFNEVMRTVGINNPLVATIGVNGSSEQVHVWQNFAIYFGGSYYTIIKGKVPLEFANIIYEKYSNSPYEIRVNGECSDMNPNDYAVDDKYKNNIQEYIEQHMDGNEYLVRCREERKKLLCRANENKYIDTYHIDTKEGLAIFLLEMKDYFARKQGLMETEVHKFDELMEIINSEILRKVNPYISTYEWMQDDPKNSKSFLETVENGRKTSFGKEFRNAIDKFDKVINPFINEEVVLDEMSNYLSRVNISFDTYDSGDGINRENCCQIHITEIPSEKVVSYYRKPDGFHYQLFYTLGDQQYLVVSHSYSTMGDEAARGEVICIDYFGENVSQKVDIEYNISKGIAGKTYGEKKNITIEQKEFIYDELLKAIDLASTITIDNMQRKGHSKHLI